MEGECEVEPHEVLDNDDEAEREETSDVEGAALNDADGVAEAMAEDEGEMRAEREGLTVRELLLELHSERLLRGLSELLPDDDGLWDALGERDEQGDADAEELGTRERLVVGDEVELLLRKGLPEDVTDALDAVVAVSDKLVVLLPDAGAVRVTVTVAQTDPVAEVSGVCDGWVTVAALLAVDDRVGDALRAVVGEAVALSEASDVAVNTVAEPDVLGVGFRGVADSDGDIDAELQGLAECDGKVVNESVG